MSVFGLASPAENVYQWNTIVRAMYHNGLFSMALAFYDEMRKSNVKPDTYTFPVVINSCASLPDIDMGRKAHIHVFEMGFCSDLYIGNALIDMYCRFGELDRAQKVFEGMPNKDIVSWNSLISGFSSNGCWEEALEIFYRTRSFGVMPDSFTLSGVILACGGLIAVAEGEIMHGLAEKMGIQIDVHVSNGLISMYFKFDKLVACQKIFGAMVAKDAVSWNTMICGYFQLGLHMESIELYSSMIFEFEPDLVTITCILQACAHSRDLKSANQINHYIRKNGYECDIAVNNMIIHMYAKCGDLLAAQEAFDSMKIRDIVSWNSIITGYIENGCHAKAVKLFAAMKMEVEPDYVTYVVLLSSSTQLADLNHTKKIHCDVIKSGYDSNQVVGNTLVDAYAKCDKMEDSLKQFENMKVRDMITWNTILAACGHSGNCTLGFKMIYEMRVEGVIPETATMLATLPLCSVLAVKQQGKEMHGCIFRLGFDLNIAIGNALIEMYSRCGSLNNSILVFRNMKRKDVVTWTTLIYAYGMYGEGRRAIDAFQMMKAAGIAPDHIAFVAIIYACSHSGLIQEGRAFFNQMKEDYGIEPRIEHYACMVDLLSRSGLLAEAENFILAMPFKPDSSIWAALLSACQTSGDMKIAERVSSHVVALSSDDTGHYVLASNVYATLGKWDQVRSIRKYLKERGLRKDPAYSWIEIQSRIYVFGTGDMFFEQYEEVNRLLKIVACLMAKEGYIVNLKSVLHDVGKHEKIELLCGHSERLAIAFGLLNTKPGTPLQIMKNLRVCRDCHAVTKYISKIVNREILVRDANRFHFFKDGTCTCGDHW